jgi:hypothetical protein
LTCPRCRRRPEQNNEQKDHAVHLVPVQVFIAVRNRVIHPYIYKVSKDIF